MKSFIAICLFLSIPLLSSCGQQTTNQGSTSEQPKDTQPVSAEQSEEISKSTALDIATAHAGVSDVTKYRIENEIEHGKAAYYIEFFSGDMVYEYYIEKSSGDIISSAFERND
jgi:uncharacterized membrane protein YkoI